LIVYVSIAVDKVPAWSNFRQELKEDWFPFSSDILKHSLRSLESFDSHASEKAREFESRIMAEFFFLDMVEKGKGGLSWNLSAPDSDDQQLLWKAAQKVLRGRCDSR
jgi:hypothetical protein